MKRDGFRVSNREVKNGRETNDYEDRSITFSHWALDDVPDTYSVIADDGITEAISFSFLPRKDASFITNAYDEYKDFEKGFLADDFRLYGLLEEQFEESRFYKHKTRNLKIKMVKVHVAGMPKAVDVYFYNGSIGLDTEGETKAIAYFKKNPDKDDAPKSRYDLSSTQKLADSLNKWFQRASLGFAEPNYKFSRVGKVNFEYSSVEFFTSDNQLYIRMNIPRNGNCDYGLKEIKAEYQGGIGYNGFVFNVSFRYNYICNDKKYENIHCFFYEYNEEQRNAVSNALKNCCR